MIIVMIITTADGEGGADAGWWRCLAGRCRCCPVHTTAPCTQLSATAALGRIPTTPTPTAPTAALSSARVMLRCDETGASVAADG